MDHKGIILIKLIAAIAIIGVLGGIATIVVGNLVDNQRKKAVLNDAIAVESAAKNYCMINTCHIDDVLTSQELNEYISNVKSGYDYTATVLDGHKYAVTFTHDNNYSFPYNDEGELIGGLIPSLASDIYVNVPLSSNEEQSTSSIPEDSPYVLLNGSENVYVEIASSYDDPSAIAYTSEGVEIGSLWTEGSVNFWQLGTYERTYHAYSSFDQENCIPATRYITVVDTTPPVITINGDETFYVDVNSYYSDWGAWAIDNSGESISIITEGVDEVDFNTVGTYYVTYTAVDSSGNEATEIRTVIVS